MNRGQKLRVVLMQACGDALAAIDTVINRSALRTTRLEELKASIQGDATRPFARAAAIADVQRFLSDPQVWTAASTPNVSTDPDLAGAFIPEILRAQTLAFAKAHLEAAHAMAEARARLAPDPAGGSPAARRHRETLRALAGSFERAHLQDAGATPDESALAPSGEVPAMYYLFEQDAESARKRQDYAGAIDALTRAIAVNDAPSLEQLASYATQAAWHATTAHDEGAPNASALLEMVERRLLKPLAEPTAPLGPRWSGEIAFWRGLVALQQAKSATDDAMVEAAAERSLRSFEAVRARGSDPKTIEAAQSWVVDAEKLQAIAAIRREGRAGPAAAALRTTAPELARQIEVSDRCRWQAVDAALRCPSPTLAAELGTEMARFLARERSLTLPATAPQRLVLEMGQPLLATDPKAQRLRSADPSRPNIQALRSVIRARYGITLPAILVRTVPDGGWLLPLLDGTPLLEPEALTPDQRFVDSAKQDADSDWLSLQLVPADGPWDVVEYAAWSLGQAVLASLPELVGLPELRDLGLGDLPPARILPFVRMLLADRTMLTERGALRARAVDVGQGRLSPRAAAEAFRRLPALRTELWGVAGTWSSIKLDPALEAELAQHVGSDELAITLPRGLSDRIRSAIDRQSAATDQRRALAAPLEQQPALVPPYAAAPKRVVVRDPAIRPFVAQLCRAGRRSTLPVVTDAEIEIAA